MFLKKLKEFIGMGLIGIFAILWPFAGPLTFVWLIYTDAQTNHSFLSWVGLIFLNGILAGLWPVYWFIQLLEYLF